MTKLRKKDSLLGTLDLLILRVLNSGEKYGYAIAQQIELLSSDALRVQKGSLYPALHRLENEGFIKAEWKISESDKPVKIYGLTVAGKKQMQAECSRWQQVSQAVNLIIQKT